MGLNEARARRPSIQKRASVEFVPRRAIRYSLLREISQMEFDEGRQAASPHGFV